MKTRYIAIVLILISFLIIPFNLIAQEETKDRLIYVSEDIVKPSMVGKYETVVKKLIGMFKDNNLAVPIQVEMADDFHFYSLLPIESMAMEKTNKAIEEVIGKIGMEKWEAPFKELFDVIEYEKTYIGRIVKKLSYSPENPRIKPSERKFLHYTYYYVKFGKSEEAIEIAEDYVNLHKSKKIQDGYNFVQIELGLEKPLFVVVAWAKEAEDYYKQIKINVDMMGEEGMKLAKRAMAITRKIEVKTGMNRPDLSYTPEK